MSGMYVTRQINFWSLIYNIKKFFFILDTIGVIRSNDFFLFTISEIHSPLDIFWIVHWNQRFNDSYSDLCHSVLKVPFTHSTMTQKFMNEILFVQFFWGNFLSFNSCGGELVLLKHIWFIMSLCNINDTWIQYFW